VKTGSLTWAFFMKETQEKRALCYNHPRVDHRYQWNRSAISSKRAGCSRGNDDFQAVLTISSIFYCIYDALQPEVMRDELPQVDSS